MIDTIVGVPVSEKLLGNYLDALVNCFYKILPMRENGEDSLLTYIRSLQIELIGCKSLICLLDEDAGFASLISILQYLIDNPNCPVKTVRREVFKTINICNKLKSRYAEVM